MPDAQSVNLSMSLLRLISKEDERLAGLALISSLRKCLCNLPEEIAADVILRVRLSFEHGLSGAQKAACSGFYWFMRYFMQQSVGRLCMLQVASAGSGFSFDVLC